MEGLLLLSCPALQMKATACVTDRVGQSYPVSGGVARGGGGGIVVDSEGRIT